MSLFLLSSLHSLFCISKKRYQTLCMILCLHLYGFRVSFERLYSLLLSSLFLSFHNRYIKDYDGGTLMECRISSKVNYLKLSALLDKQRKAAEACIEESTTKVLMPGLDVWKVRNKGKQFVAFSRFYFPVYHLIRITTCRYISIYICLP